MGRDPGTAHSPDQESQDVIRLRQLALVACFAGIGLMAAKSRVRSPHDLDSYSDAQLMRDLTDELDDIYPKLGDPNGSTISTT